MQLCCKGTQQVLDGLVFTRSLEQLGRELELGDHGLRQKYGLGATRGNEIVGNLEKWQPCGSNVMRWRWKLGW